MTGQGHLKRGLSLHSIFTTRSVESSQTLRWSFVLVFIGTKRVQINVVAKSNIDFDCVFGIVFGPLGQLATLGLDSATKVVFENCRGSTQECP